MDGERRQNGLHLPPIRAFMNNMTLITIVSCTNWLLERLNMNLRWARIGIKPSKSRSILGTKGSCRTFMVEVLGQ